MKTWKILGTFVLIATVLILFIVAMALGIERELNRERIDRMEWEAFVYGQAQ